MSAYMVDREHIRFLVSAARLFSRSRIHLFGWSHASRNDGWWNKFDGFNQDAASELGQILWTANLDSVEERYPDTKDSPARIPGRIGEVYIYSHSKDWPSDMIDAVQVLKSVACLEYQSCEYDGWKKSEAAAICEALRTAAINSLPGYDKAKWGAPLLPARSGGGL